MSHDVFEDRLRAELRGATDAEAPAFLDIDPTEVLGTGRRVVRRRRMAMAGGTLAAVTVLGVGSWAVLDRSADRAAPEVPATRTTLGTGEARVAFDGPDGDGGVEYTVTLDRATGRVSTLVRDGDSGVNRDIGSVPSSGTGAVWGTASDRPFVVLGVVPDEADHVMTRYDGSDLGGTQMDDAPLPGTAFKAIIVTSEKSPGGAALSGLDYAVAGRVFTSDGTELPSATVGDRTVYVDAAGGEIGIVEPDGSATRPLPAAGSGDRPHLLVSRGTDDQHLVTTASVVIPIAAQDVAVEVAPGATLRSMEAVPLFGGSGLAVVAVLDAPDTVRPVVTKVTWTIDGQPGSWTNPD